MPVTASRLLLRQSRFLIRRPVVRSASTTSEAAAKSKDAAAKASEGLSKVAATAGPAIANAMQGIGGALRKVGGRTGKLVAFVDSLVPPTLYYSKVGFEVAKIVVRGQKMTPPSVAEFQTYFQPLLNALRQPTALLSRTASFSQNLLSNVRNLDRRQLAFVGVTTAEVIGFFSVGEMLGRMKIVGYRGEPAHGH
ncbi:hypothetical protein AJ80_01803 [Polytolypa hystricis UAMH7299]|uniref:Mitochondrial F1F0-ATP synthase g subunit n=1 Tax=Polytolypa hystricis (strain UAMH7299) TaxID=1447883 RepID=A0A2B7YZS1_POLH7|nr:hypothetical protein AJ80_01803 [Polytolypa hystricis UAMH7299]